MPGILSPNAKNYVVGKGFAIFTPDGGVANHIGNMPKFVYTPKVDILPHFSSMAGIKVQDFSTILQAGGSIAADLEEMTAFNLSLFFNGTVDTSVPTAVTVGMYDQLEQISGAISFYATNNVGPRWNFNFTRVLLNPTGPFNPISDQYNAMTVNMTHVIDDEGLFGTMVLQPDVRTINPENVLLPFIDGPLLIGDEPAYTQVGETLTANVGQWIGSQGYAYQWKKGGTNITLNGTSKTYIPITGDIGGILSVQVTARNSNGTTTATSGNSLAVHS